MKTRNRCEDACFLSLRLSGDLRANLAMPLLLQKVCVRRQMCRCVQNRMQLLAMCHGDVYNGVSSFASEDLMISDDSFDNTC